jgi:DNA polymerase IIIc chi subunit
MELINLVENTGLVSPRRQMYHFVSVNQRQGEGQARANFFQYRAAGWQRMQ